MASTIKQVDDDINNAWTASYSKNTFKFISIAMFVAIWQSFVASYRHAMRTHRLRSCMDATNGMLSTAQSAQIDWLLFFDKRRNAVPVVPRTIIELATAQAGGISWTTWRRRRRRRRPYCTHGDVWTFILTTTPTHYIRIWWPPSRLASSNVFVYMMPDNRTR